LGEDHNEISMLGKPALSNVRVTGFSSNASAPQKTQKASGQSTKKSEVVLDALDAAAKNMQSDAPACNVCGHITIRNGTCYKCLNCGNSMGCS
jgi:ribonucleoside-diphosphate reductase alpha chain